MNHTSGPAKLSGRCFILFNYLDFMPEYPDITIYIERLKAIVLGQPIENIRFANPFFLHSVDPQIDSIKNERVQGFERIGKRIVFVFPNEYFLVLHLMIAGRLFWKQKRFKIPPKRGLAALDFANGSLLITEAGTKKRASMYLAKGLANLEYFDAGGLEIFTASFDNFHNRLQAENHTLKRALTDPRLFSGIGNAYSDEILHCAKLSPVLQTKRMSLQQIKQLHEATISTLEKWTKILREETGDGFPENVTAFRKDMAVHGKFGKPCPVCGKQIQRIRFASNETNYCPNCQTEGKLLADRSLSRLLKKD